MKIISECSYLTFSDKQTTISNWALLLMEIARVQCSRIPSAKKIAPEQKQEMSRTKLFNSTPILERFV